MRIEISDPDGRWPTRKIDLDPNDFPLDFQWDRRFKDGTVAPLGSYKFKIFATDKMGHTTQRHASIKILLGILPDAAPIPFGDTQGEPADLSVVPALTVETSPQSIAPAPRAAPTKTTVSERIESIFAPSSTEVTTTDVTSESNDDAFQYATYAAMLAAVTTYTLAEKKKREEEARRQTEEPSMTRQEAKRAKQRKELQKIWDANGAAIYEANQAAKNANSNNKIPPPPSGVSLETQAAFMHGGSTAQGWIEKNVESLRTAYVNQLEQAKERAKAKETQQAMSDWKAGEKVSVLENESLACTPDNPYGIPRHNPNAQTPLEWLISLYNNDNLPGTTAMERTRWVLSATENGPEFLGLGYPHTHFNLENLAPGDGGFDSTYQDPWVSSKNQNGHFLTALDFSLYANDSRLSDISKGTLRWVALSSIIGHEMVGDDVGKYENADLTSFIQTGVGMLANIVTLNAVNRWFLSGEDKNFQKIAGSKLGQGNSMEDLRLSYEGWIAGEEIANGNIQTPQEFSQWITDNLR